MRTARKNFLTKSAASRMVDAMDKTAILAAASLAALLALGACKNEPEVIDTNPDPQAEVLKNAAPVEAPPMIQASRTYRCKDNSLLYANFYTNNTVRVRTEPTGEGTLLTATDGQPPFVAEGYSLSANAAQVSYTAPGKGTLSCKA
jgi:hypothetical protein